MSPCASQFCCCHGSKNDPKIVPLVSSEPIMEGPSADSGEKSEPVGISKVVGSGCQKKRLTFASRIEKKKRGPAKTSDVGTTERFLKP